MFIHGRTSSHSSRLHCHLQVTVHWWQIIKQVYINYNVSEGSVVKLNPAIDIIAWGVEIVVRWNNCSDLKNDAGHAEGWRERFTWYRNWKKGSVSRTDLDPRCVETWIQVVRDERDGTFVREPEKPDGSSLPTVLRRLEQGTGVPAYGYRLPRRLWPIVGLQDPPTGAPIGER